MKKLRKNYFHDTMREGKFGKAKTSAATISTARSEGHAHAVCGRRAELPRPSMHFNSKYILYFKLKFYLFEDEMLLISTSNQANLDFK